MQSSSESRRTWTAGASVTPVDLSGVRWHDGTVECRFRLIHSAGSLVAADGEVGEVLTDTDTACTTCSNACTL